MDGVRRLLMTVAVASALVAFAATVAKYRSEILVAFWGGRLQRIPDDQAAAWLGRIGPLGRPGANLLAEALDSPRPAVASAARELLWSEITRSATLDPATARARLGLVVEALACRVDRFGPAAKADAARMAQQILLRPLGDAAADRGRLLEACQAVLNAANRATVLGSTGGQGGLSRESEKAAQPARPRLDAATETSSGRSSSREATRPESRPPRAQRGSTHHAARTAREVTFNAPAALAQPPELLIQPDARPIRFAIPSLALLPCRRPETASAGGETPRPEATEAETIRRMRDLHASDPGVAEAARAELIAQGFSEGQIELAQRLFDPDPTVRRELARALIELGSIDPLPWLLHLCRDEDPQVRLTALSLLATTGDPTLLRQVAEMVRRDPDPEVQRLSERLDEPLSGPVSLPDSGESARHISPPAK